MCSPPHRFVNSVAYFRLPNVVFSNQLPWFFSSSPNQAVPVRYPPRTEGNSCPLLAKFLQGPRYLHILFLLLHRMGRGPDHELPPEWVNSGSLSLFHLISRLYGLHFLSRDLLSVGRWGIVWLRFLPACVLSGWQLLIHSCRPGPGFAGAHFLLICGV